MNILIIEDDIFLATRIGKVFESIVISNRVVVIHSFGDFLKQLPILESYDIVLTDLKLSENWGKYDGYSIIEIIRRKSSSIPVVVISGFDDPGILQKAFTLGASDYIIKPIRLAELEVRILNWFKNFYLPDIFHSKTNAQYNNLSYCIESNEFFFDGEVVVLTKKSKYILSIFFSQPEKLISERELIEKIWGDPVGIANRNLRVNISRLKQSLHSFGIDNRIQNIHGEGYLISAQK